MLLRTFVRMGKCYVFLKTAPDIGTLWTVCSSWAELDALAPILGDGEREDGTRMKRICSVCPGFARTTPRSVTFFLKTTPYAQTTLDAVSWKGRSRSHLE